MENRIKEQMHLFADRLSTNEMKANQLRLYFSALAYTLMEALRRLGLKGTEWAQAQVDTIRSKLFKIGAIVRINVRRILLQMSRAYPRERHLHLSLPRNALLKLRSHSPTTPLPLLRAHGWRSHAKNPGHALNKTSSAPPQYTIWPAVMLTKHPQTKTSP